MKIIINKKDILWGGIILAVSDGFAAYLTGGFSWIRFFGLLVIGSTLYAVEIPTFFAWLEKYTKAHYTSLKRKIIKAVAVVIFFNPIWLFRHFAFIDVFTGQFDLINLHLLQTASLSYLVNIPMSLIGNYIIQNVIALNWRFIASSIYSAIMIIYFALSQVYFQ